MVRKKEICSSENHEPGAGIVLMKLEELHSFEGHPFKVERNQELFELRCSIEKEGSNVIYSLFNNCQHCRRAKEYTNFYAAVCIGYHTSNF